MMNRLGNFHNALFYRRFLASISFDVHGIFFFRKKKQIYGESTGWRECAGRAVDRRWWARGCWPRWRRGRAAPGRRGWGRRWWPPPPILRCSWRPVRATENGFSFLKIKHTHTQSGAADWWSSMLQQPTTETKMADKKNEVNWNQVFRCDRATFLASFFLQKDVVPLPGNPITRSELRGPASGPECIRLAEREKVGLATGTGWIRISQMVRKIKTKPKKEKEKKHARRTRKTTANTCYLLISPPPPNFLYFFSHRWCFGGFLFFFLTPHSFYSIADDVVYGNAALAYF